MDEVTGLSSGIRYRDGEELCWEYRVVHAFGTVAWGMVRTRDEATDLAAGAEQRFIAKHLPIRVCQAHTCVCGGYYSACECRDGSEVCTCHLLEIR